MDDILVINDKKIMQLFQNCMNISSLVLDWFLDNRTHAVVSWCFAEQLDNFEQRHIHHGSFVCPPDSPCNVLTVIL